MLHCDKLQATAFQYFSIHTQKLEENYCCEYFQSIIFNGMDLYASCGLQLSPSCTWWWIISLQHSAMYPWTKIFLVYLLCSSVCNFDC
jgi:hypothetical protein